MKEMWDERYSSEEYAYGTLPNLFFKEKLEELAPGQLLLPAEGEGRNAVFAAQSGWKVQAVDYSAQARVKALRLADQQNVRIAYQVGDITRLSFGHEVYDAAALIYAHLSPEFRKSVHQKIVDSLKPGGYIILEAFNPKQMRNQSGGPRSVEMLYTIPMLKDDFKGIEPLLLKEYDILLEQGEFHQGQAAVIRMFGRKI